MALLRKNTGIAEIAPAVPGIPGESPVSFRLFAPPTPQGTAYRYRANPRFVTTAELLEMVDNGTVIDMTGATPSYGPGGVLLGYEYLGDPVITKVSDFNGWATNPFYQPSGPAGQWFGPIPGMVYVVFPDVPTAPNGFPVVAGNPTLQGYFDMQVDAGALRVWRSYRKDNNGRYRPVDITSTPQRLTTKNNVAMWSNYPGRPPVPAIAPQFGIDYREGWNDGANSIESHSADCRTEFQFQVKALAACGLQRPGREDVGDFSQLTHAFYAAMEPGGLRAYVIESGAVRAGPFAITPDSLLEIRRIEGLVTYSIDTNPVYSSRIVSSGPVEVGSSFYRGGDAIP